MSTFSRKLPPTIWTNIKKNKGDSTLATTVLFLMGSLNSAVLVPVEVWKVLPDLIVENAMSRSIGREASITPRKVKPAVFAI